MPLFELFLAYLNRDLYWKPLAHCIAHTKLKTTISRGSAVVGRQIMTSFDAFFGHFMPFLIILCHFDQIWQKSLKIHKLSEVLAIFGEQYGFIFSRFFIFPGYPRGKLKKWSKMPFLTYFWSILINFSSVFGHSWPKCPCGAILSPVCLFFSHKQGGELREILSSAPRYWQICHFWPFFAQKYHFFWPKIPICCMGKWLFTTLIFSRNARTPFSTIKRGDLIQVDPPFWRSFLTPGGAGIP